MLHVYLLCALLTAHQTKATCWRFTSATDNCEVWMRLWLAEAANYASANPDNVIDFYPAVSCSIDSGSLPPGAVLVDPEKAYADHIVPAP